ncbi:MAG: YihY/virulence factor BrkB family protein [Dermatophilaceae bacterium]
MATEGTSAVKAGTAPDPEDPRKPDSPTELSKPSWRYTAKTALREFTADQCTDQAAALTYYAVLALFPALLALVSMLGIFGQGESTVNAMLDMVRSLGQQNAAQVLEEPVRQMVTAQGAGIGLVVGLGIALWSASGYIGAFGRALNRVYEVDEGRPIWKLRPLQLFITLICVLAMALALMAIVVSGPLARAIGDTLGVGAGAVTAFNIVKWPIILAVVIVIVALLYYATPNVRQPKFHWISVGAAIGIGVWLLASAVFGFYVSNFGSYNKTYGSLAGVIIFLLWLWLTNLALLFGAEVDSELERARELEAGIEAEETLQLPPRDTKKSDKAAAKREEVIAEGRAIREAAEEAQAAEADAADGEPGSEDVASDDQGSNAGLALGVAGGAAQNAVNKILRRKK